MKCSLYIRKRINGEMSHHHQIVETDNIKKYFIQTIENYEKSYGYKSLALNEDLRSMSVHYSTRNLGAILCSDIDNEIFITMDYIYENYPLILKHETILRGREGKIIEKYNGEMICNNEKELLKIFKKYRKQKDLIIENYSIMIQRATKEFDIKDRQWESLIGHDTSFICTFTSYFKVYSKEEYMELTL